RAQAGRDNTLDENTPLMSPSWTFKGQIKVGARDFAATTTTLTGSILKTANTTHKRACPGWLYMKLPRQP
ncbi:MAG: hypothetical protein M1600_14095, partial [Firmicutes bacterium]|nr:hypothetical protein [Bacillota bacterium]